MAGLRWTVPIPKFLFANRQTEIAAINEFLTHPDARGQLLLVLAPSGYGKSRLLDHVTFNPADAVAPIFLNSKRHEGTEAGLAAAFAFEVEQLLASRGLRHVGDSVSDSYRSSARFIGGMVPKLVRGAPIFGAAAEYTAESLVEALSRSSAVHIEVIRRSFERLSTRLRNTTIIVIVDDVHALLLAEQYVLSDLVTLGHEVDDMDVRYILGSRPLTDETPGSIRELCDRLAADGKLARIDLSPLADETMREIAVSLSSTPIALEPAIEVAGGNPQRFLQSLIDLNFAGALLLEDGMLRVPVNTAVLGATVGTVLEKLEPVPARVFGTLAVARHDVTLDSLQSCYGLLGAPNSSDVVSALQKLIDTRLIDARDITIGGRRQTGLYVAHDSVRDLARNELRTKRLIDYLFANEVAAEIADHQISLLNLSASGVAGQDADLHGFVIGRALCRREAKKSGWEQDAITALASAEASSRLDDIIDLGATLLESYRNILKPDAEPRASIARLFVRANYQLGNYADCIRFIDDEGLDDGESLYIRAISYAIIKPDSDTVGIVSAARARVHARDDDSAWKPLLILTEAVALQESGAFAEADRLYENYLAEVRHNRDTPQFWQFAYSAPLFIDPRRSHDLAREAFEWFEARNNDRSSGMAANNQGYAAMRMREYDVALHHFDVSLTRLNRNCPHEAVFPLTNISLIHIVRGEAEAARSALTSCLFRRLWPDYEAGVLINMAYATWLAGRDDPQRFLRRIRHSPGMEHDAWGMALEEYARCFLKLQPRSGAPTERDLKECAAAVRRLDSFATIAPYWNALVRDVRSRFGLEGTQMSISPFGTGFATTDPDVSLMRPAERCFAHI